MFARSGSYAGFTIARSGTQTDPIIFQSYPAEVATLLGDGGRSTVVNVSGAHDVTIRGLKISGAPFQWGAGVRVQNGAYRVTIEVNSITANRSFGVLLQGVNEVAVRTNDINHNETGVEISGGGQGVDIVSSQIHDNDQW